MRSTSVTLVAAKRSSIVAKPHDWRWGYGSVFKRQPYVDNDGYLKGGGWKATVTIDGKRMWLSAKTEDEAWQKLKALKDALAPAPNGHGGTHARQTVDEFLRGWLKTLKKRPNTVRTYGEAIEGYLAPGFKGVPIKLLTSDRVREFFARVTLKNGRPMAASSIRRLHRVLRRALNAAVARDYIQRNPAAIRDVTDSLPALPFEPFDVWTREQVNRFFKAVKGDPLEAFYYVALMHGLRVGEILGLTWSDMNFKQGTVFVHQQLQSDELAPLKTESHRTLTLEPPVIHLLRRLRVSQAPINGKTPAKWHDLVFRNVDGGPLNRSNVSQRSFNRAIHRAGLARITLHDLRHTFGTLHAANGTDVLEIKYLMGHARIDTTLKYIKQAAINPRAAAANRRLWTRSGSRAS